MSIDPSGPVTRFDPGADPLAGPEGVGTAPPPPVAPPVVTSGGRSRQVTKAPASRGSRRRAGTDRPVRRGRRVKRVIRRIELWSVLKLAVVFYTCMYAVAMATLAVLWGFAHSAGLVDNFESFANDVGFENWQFYGEDMFRQAAIIGGVLVITATVLTVLAAALVNVISELTGGIRVVVIEEELVSRSRPDGADGARR